MGVFVVTWAVALLIWRFGRIEAKWDDRRPSKRARRGWHSTKNVLGHSRERVTCDETWSSNTCVRR